MCSALAAHVLVPETGAYNDLTIVGHMSIRKEPDSEWSTIVKAIREVHPHTPITVFGGHHHVSGRSDFYLSFLADLTRNLQIRDCVREDRYSMSLAAGRYMETVGWMSELRLLPSQLDIY